MGSTMAARRRDNLSFAARISRLGAGGWPLADVRPARPLNRLEPYQSLGIEIDAQCFALAKKAVPQLAALYPTFQGETTELEADYAPASPNSDQLALALADKTPPVLHSTKSRAGRAVQPLSYKKPAAAA